MCVCKERFRGEENGRFLGDQALPAIVAIPSCRVTPDFDFCMCGGVGNQCL